MFLALMYKQRGERIERPLKFMFFLLYMIKDGPLTPETAET